MEVIDLTPPFVVRVVAPLGFEVPDLARRMWARLYPHVRAGEGPLPRGVRRTDHPRDGEISKERGWSSVPGHCGRWSPNRRAACASVAIAASALVVLHEGGLDRDMRDVLGWCDWLGVETRVVDLTEEEET